MLTRQKIIIGASISLCILVVGIVLSPVTDHFVQESVVKEVRLVKDGYLYSVWKEPPMPIYLDVYMFNLTNPLEVKQGAKPAVQEIGPYVYMEKRIKYNVTFNQNGTITYRQKRIFLFMRNMSVGDESDKFVTVNPPLLTLIEALTNFNPELRKIILDVVGTMEDIFMTRSMKEIVWGYVDPSLKIAHEIYPSRFYTDFIGYFMNKNNTNDGIYTIYSGRDDVSKLGIIDRYNGSSFLPYWTSVSANKINGSDGTIYPPFQQDTDFIQFFSTDVCRSGFAKYTSDVTIKDTIHLRRYTATAREMANKTVNPDNAGFCTNRSGCLGTGVLDLSVCTHVDYFPIPAIMSFPHFYLADPKFVKGIIGMKPSKLKHETALDIEPITGLLLQASKKLQINMQITHIPDLKILEGIKTTILPVFWANERTIVDDKNAERLRSTLFVPVMVAKIVQYLFIGLGSVAFIFCLFLDCKLQNNMQGKSANGEKAPLLNNTSMNTTDEALE